MRSVLGLLALAACGRVGFDPRGDATSVPIGHDEDGDGVADVEDVCPHLADSQRDGDGDRVGDACDPNPVDPRDTIARFATMVPGDQPLTTTLTSANFVQRDDSLELVDLAQSGDAHLEMPLVVGDVRLAIGFDIVDRIDPASQNQFAIALRHAVPFYYVEINESLTEQPMWHYAAITFWNGVEYSSGDARDLATIVHPGAVFFQTTQRVGGGVKFDVSWPGEPYVAEVMDGVYQGGDSVEININNLYVEIRWLIVITSS